MTASAGNSAAMMVSTGSTRQRTGGNRGSSVPRNSSAQSSAAADSVSCKGIKADGALTVNGGTLKLTCNGNGNTAIDTNGTFTHNGGSITTNDGSESGNGMGRGRGAMSGAKSSGGRK